MPKKKERSSDEWYRKQIRSLEKEIRQLKKYIRELEKRDHKFESYMEEAKFADPVKVIKYCPECGKGQLEFFEVVGKQFEECSVCNYRKKLK